MLFRLKTQDEQGNKTGIHIEGDKIYHPGDTVESDVDLSKLLRNKFELLSSDADVVRPVIAGSKPTPIERNGGARPMRSPARSTLLDLTEDYPQAQAVGVVVLYNTKTKRFAVKKDNKILVRMKQIVSLENYLDGLAE